MKLIKLDAIDSTNDFLKDLARNSDIENFTTVITNNQTKGKGQMGAKWDSEVGKNLIMSVLIKNLTIEFSEIFNLNSAVSTAVIQVLKELNIPMVSIKWPNDIMSDNKKIGGILIENSFKSDNTIDSVIGIGLNVNQKDFLNLPNASSLSVVTNLEFDLEMILEKIINEIKINYSLLSSDKSDFIKELYHQNLFKKGIPMAFEDKNGTRFMGIIQQVSNEGLLQVIHEDDSIHLYDLKEIQMLY